MWPRAFKYNNKKGSMKLCLSFSLFNFKKVITLNLLFLLSLGIIGCDDSSTDPIDNLSEKPVVKKTNTNYDRDSFRETFPDTAVLNRISGAYSDIYSGEIKTDLINYMKLEAKQLGEEQSVFTECMGLTGCSDTSLVSLPTYAEKAEYDGKEVWIIQLVWGNEPRDLNHYKCFAFGVDEMDTLDYYRCY